MKNLVVLLFFLNVTISYAQSTLTGNITHDGQNRNYRLRLPANHDKNVSIPLVFNMHGFTSNASHQELYSSMNAVADTARFAVCYPNGIGNAWNVGWSFGSTVDDVGFISAMIDKFHTEFGIDKSRVYACGMSNGGFMSYRLACELNDRIAAIASVTGSMVQQAVDNCKPGKAVPVMEIHGTADETVNYNGSPNVSIAIPQIMKLWQENNGCKKDPIIEMVPNINATDNTTTEKWTYTDCTKDKRLIHYKVLNGGHTWPGAPIALGNTSQDFRASVEIWNFFKQYKLSNTSSINENVPSFAKIYPNPVYDVLNIYAEFTSGQSFAIIDTYGKVWIQDLLKEDKTIVNVQDLPSGLYIIKMLIQDSIGKSIKFIKVN
jgi:polyhydroxybutyrate depolymerase